MTAEDIKAYCLSKHKACETYPFGKVPVCYKLNDKIFAQLYPDEGNYKITLKCTADAAQFYRMVYPDKIMEGYHCSKVQKPYWNTIYLDAMFGHVAPRGAAQEQGLTVFELVRVTVPGEIGRASCRERV